MAWIDADTLWPAVPSPWLIADRGDWLAIDKPTEVGAPPGLEPLELGNAAWRNDLWSRIRRGLPELAPAGLPLCTLFDPLDGELKPRPDAGAGVSGLCIVSRRPETTEALTQHERQGHVRLSAVAGVHGWPGERDRRQALQTRLSEAGIHLRQEQVTGRRALLTLQYASGRCLDLVRELERLGLQVAGPHSTDPLAPRAPRLFLHRCEVAMPAATLQSTLPVSFARWLADAEPEPLEERLDAALRRRYVLGHSADTRAFRLLDSLHEDLTIDRYGADIVLSRLLDVSEHTGAVALQETLAGAVALARRLGERLHARAVYLKLRPRQANTVVDALAAGLTPESPVYGPLPSGPCEVEENGLHFGVRLGGALGTGIYLDQRDNRRWVRDQVAGLRVLNTFAYTCAFSVAAAAGGAARTVSIDAAASALELGRLNLERNGFGDASRHDLIRGDVFHWLPRLARRGDRFDFIILDPPSYSSVKGKRFSAASDYADLVATVASLLAPGGTLLACTNSAGIDRKRLHQMVVDGALAAGRSVGAVQHRPNPLDHPAGRMKALCARFD